jgi:hypothetical protein
LDPAPETLETFPEPASDPNQSLMSSAIIVIGDMSGQR